MMKIFLIAAVILSSAVCFAQNISWSEVDDGLYYGEFKADVKTDFADSVVSVLKIDPAKYNFHLLSSKEDKSDNKTADEWAKDNGLLAVINAGMFIREDHKTNCGFMKNFDFINNSVLTKDNTVTAFNRKDKSVPEFQIIDLQDQDWDVLKEKYNSFTQSIRMISSNQNNVWTVQEKYWSVVTIGKDKDGNALFIFCRSPYRMHDFVNIILKAPLNIYNMMYLEGGPEASFYVNHNGFVIGKMGSYETGFNENDSNVVFWEIPNVIGITKK